MQQKYIHLPFGSLTYDKKRKISESFVKMLASHCGRS